VALNIDNLLPPTGGTTPTGRAQGLLQLGNLMPPPGPGGPGTTTSSQKPDDPGFSPLGFVKNAFGDVKDMVTGLTSLIGMGVGDLARLGTEAVTFGQAETGGYKLAQMARMFPAAIASDYARRYGSIGGFLKGIYEDPLFFLGDVTMVAGGASLAAKGLAMAKIIPEELAAAIRGSTFAGGVETKGVATVASVTGEQVPFKFALSTNPVRRGFQQLGIKAATRTPGGTLAALEGQFALPLKGEVGMLQGPIGEAMVRGVVKDATEAGIRIMKPSFSAAISKHGVTRMAAIAGLKLAEQSSAGKAAFTKAYDTFLRGADDAETAANEAVYVEMSHGLDVVPDGMPESVVPVNFRLPGETPVLPETIPGQFTGRDHGVLKQLQEWADVHGKQTGVEEGGFGARGQRLSMLDYDTPHSIYDPSHPSGDVVVRVTDMSTDIPDAVKGITGKIGYRVQGIVNDMNKQGLWHGVMARFVSPDGSRAFNVNFATEGTEIAQKAVSKMLRDRTNFEAEAQKLAADIASGLDDSNVMAARLHTLESEIEAVDAKIGNAWTEPLREMNDVGHVYTGPVRMADRMQNVAFLHATQYEIPHGLSYTAQMNRAYGPQRILEYDLWLKDMKERFAGILERAGGDHDTAAFSLMHELENVLGKNHPAIEDIMRGDFMAEGGVDRLMSRLINQTRDTMAVDGNWNGFRWQQFHEEVLRDPSRIAPQYVPHYRMGPKGLSQMAFAKQTAVGLSEAEPGTMKRWMGYLYEEGRFNTDMTTVYDRLWSQIARHHESMDLYDTVLNGYGFKLTPQMAQDFRVNDYQGYVLMSPAHTKGMIDLRSKMISDTHFGMSDGKTIERATIDMIQGNQEEILKRGIAGLADDIYMVPKHIAEELTKKVNLGLGTKMQMYWDGPMNLWKTAVLSLSPRWVLNNTVGNLIFMGIANPGAIRNFVKTLGPTEHRVARLMVGDELANAVERNFTKGVVEKTPFAEIKGVTGAPLPGSNLAQRVLRWGEPTRVAWFSKSVRNLNVYIEDSARMGVFVSNASKEAMGSWASRFSGTGKQMEEVARNGIDNEAQYAGALKAVDAVLGDYLTMGPIEKNIIRRYIMPFYGFYRHSAKFMARVPLGHPLAASILDKIDVIDQEIEGVQPGFLRGSINLSMWGADDVFARINNLNPLQALVGLPGEGQPILAATLNPAIKTMLESQMGVSTLTGEPFRPDPGEVIETFRGTQFQILRNPDGTFAGVKRLEGKWMPPLWQRVASQFPQAGLVGQLPGVPNVDIFGRSGLQQVASLAGTPYTTFDLDRYRVTQILDEIQATQKAVRAVALNP